MRNIILSLIVLGATAATAFGQDNPNFAAALIPPALLENANAVVREQQVLFDVKSAGEASFKEHRAVTVLNEDSPYRVLQVHYNTFNKLGKVKGKIFDSAGSLVREIGKKEVRHISAISDFSTFEDDHYLYVEVDYAEYPFTVEFEYELGYTDLMNYPDWQIAQFATSVQSAGFTVRVGPGLGLSTKSLNIEMAPRETGGKDGRTLTWLVENLPAVKYEPFGPPTADLLPMLLVSPHVFEVNKYQGSMANWSEYGHFMNQLMKGRDELSPAMKAKVAELTASASSEEEKIKRLYRYVQENMRYVSVQLGLGGWQPFDAKYVETNKFGDCKALSNFMMALLKEAGIASNPVLIYSGDPYYEVTDDFTIPAFNHMILYVPSSKTWLDCTQEHAPVNYLGTHLADRNVLLVTSDGGQLSRTPAIPSTDNLERNHLTINLLPTGEATIDVQSHRSGDRHDWYRYAAKALAKSEIQEKFQQASSLKSFTLERFDVAAAADSPTAEITYLAQVPRFASKAGKRLFVPINPVSQLDQVPPSNDSRKNPVFVRDGYVEEDIVTMRIPEGFTAESIPNENFVLERPFGTYSMQVKVENGTVTMNRRLEMRPVKLPASEYNAWRDFHKEVAKADGVKLVLVGM